MNVKELARHAKAASAQLSSLDGLRKKNFLLDVARQLSEQKDRLMKANKLDIEREKNAQLRNRLELDGKKIEVLSKGLKKLADMHDLIGKVSLKRELDKGLVLEKISCPIGVIGVIFESRPDALVQIASLCFKSGNCVILKGGKEAINTNKALFDIFREISRKYNIDPCWISLLLERKDVDEMLKLHGVIDMIIPRGSNSLVQHIMENTKIPVLGHADGVCHIYVDKKAKFDDAIKICIDAKCNYPAACNAAETIIVDKKIASSFLPRLKESMPDVEFFGDKDSAKMLKIKKVKDWHTEYGDLKLSIKIAKNIDEAINHINTFGSGHTDAILTKDKKAADMFISKVDSANVFWNCSTRFSDGYRYGFGAEVGISTSKIHARGPVGIEGLLIYKWRLSGKGALVSDYMEGKRKFNHRDVK